MQKIRMLTLLFVGVALMWGPVSLKAMDKEANTIDELVSMFDKSSCIECHEEIHNLWSQSWHAQSVASSLGSIHNFIEIGFKTQWNTEVTWGAFAEMSRLSCPCNQLSLRKAGGRDCRYDRHCCRGTGTIF